jgi:uncharacterized protein YdeI (YjbR/CyaY-like superfamily)
MGADSPTPSFFAGPAEFRSWLERNHDRADEAWVGFHRRGTGRGGLTYPEAVDEALCFGWIDGIRRSLDETSYANRFTPRRPRSHWSRINVTRAGELIAAGRMAPAGIRAFEARDSRHPDGGDGPSDALDGPREATFRAAPAAWAFFEAQPPGYRRLAAGWVMAAKRDETRDRRLATLIADSAAGRRIAPLARTPAEARPRGARG